MIGTILGIGSSLLSSHFNQKNQVKQQKRLNEVNKDMGRFNAEQSLDIWNKTNAKAQIEHYKKAGLNSGLMYGTSGASGQSMSPASGNSQADSKPLDIGSISQLALIKAQKDNLDADTKLKNANATKTAGVDTESATIDNAIKQIQLYVDENSKENNINNIKSIADKALGESRSAMVKGTIDENTQIQQAQRIITEATTAVLNNQAILQGIKLDKAKIEEITNSIDQKWEELRLQDKSIETQKETMRNMMETMLWQSGINATGNLVNTLIDLRLKKGFNTIKETIRK